MIPSWDTMIIIDEDTIHDNLAIVLLLCDSRLKCKVTYMWNIERFNFLYTKLIRDYQI